eukprot:gene27723-7369_t
MDQNAAFIALAALALLVATVGILFFKVIGSEQAKQAVEENETGEAEGSGVGGARRRDRMGAGRLRRRAAAAAAAQAESDESGGSEDDSDDEGEGNMNQRERAKKAKKAAREAERIARELKEGKKNAYEEKRKKKDDEREAQELAQEEEIKRAQEERQAKEDAEASKWMSIISMDEAGTEQTEEQQDTGGMLAQFVDYIRGRKTVPLEQLAIEFKIRTTDVIDRIQGLEAMGRLTGVMDERGKYIYISEDEMKSVANYIINKGRVGIHELATRSNEFIDLEAKAEDVGACAERPTIDFDSLIGDE